MHLIRLATLSLLILWSFGAGAADLSLENADCAKILERWAENPNSVPKRLVDACKEQMAAAPAAVAAVPPPPAPVDPCTGPNAAGSVLCWGPWATLAPAAAAPVAALEFPEYPSTCETGLDYSDQCVAVLEPLSAPEPGPPVEGCAPGTPCGFATRVAGLTSNGDVEATEFEKFDLAADGTSFVVDPGGPDEIQSAAMAATVTPRNDGYENLRSSNGSTDNDHQSRLIARIVRGEADGETQAPGPILLAADVWTNGSRTTSAINQSGYFAWGIATSQSGLNLLNGNGVSVAFSGRMSVNEATAANMTVNFGSQPTWTGTWTNQAWSFGAGGTVSGVNLISSSSQFTSNVQPGGLVQGALVGEPGQQGIAHLIDVNLTGQGHVKDVGLLRQVANGPGIGVGTAP